MADVTNGMAVSAERMHVVRIVAAACELDEVEATPMDTVRHSTNILFVLCHNAASNSDARDYVNQILDAYRIAMGV